MIYLGIDLGGTNIAIGVVTEDGEILNEDSTLTNVGRPFEDIIGDMGKLGLKVLAESGYTLEDVKAVGIGSPGSMENETGTIIFANNLFWRNVNVRDELSKYIPKPIFLDNDANVAGLAEIAIGAAKGIKNLVLLTLGTGVGGGVVINGEIFGGSHHVGAELGHMTLVVDGEMCTCGNKGCLERYTSATALIREGRKAIVNNPDCAIAIKSESKLDNVTAKIVIDAAKEGDMIAKNIFEDYIKYLTMSIITIINCFDPEVIALGGGVAKAGAFLIDALNESVAKHIFYKELGSAKIVLSPLGNEAGIVGAAMLAKIWVNK